MGTRRGEPQVLLDDLPQWMERLIPRKCQVLLGDVLAAHSLQDGACGGNSGRRVARHVLQGALELGMTRCNVTGTNAVRERSPGSRARTSKDLPARLVRQPATSERFVNPTAALFPGLEEVRAVGWRTHLQELLQELPEDGQWVYARIGVDLT